MGDYDDVGLLFENYKSFGPGPVGFDQIATINVIVGRNNSGKSALIDLLEYAASPKAIPTHLYHGKRPSLVVLSSHVSERTARTVFKENTSGGPLTGNHWGAGKQLVGSLIKVELRPNAPGLVELSKNIDHLATAKGSLRELYEQLATQIANPFLGKFFFRLSADRDIATESITGTPNIEKSGQGYTSTIVQILNRFEHPTSLVAEEVLDALNEIFVPDSLFRSIDVQQYGDNGPWEVFLDEKGKGRIALSHSGSGLKTALLVVAAFLIVPYLRKKQLKGALIALEEPENNLHPALQRRLLRYASQKARKNESVLFLTTHSNVVIDFFSRDKDAQILHVTNQNGRSQVRRVQTYVENCGVLDDLDVRASDLLQANGIVWLEGPSDRLYFNRWVELVSEGHLVEGTHYQCVFYGGRLLAHLSASDPNVDAGEVVKILRVNRNAILLMDSDKANDGDTINKTKTRMLDEIKSLDGMAWITKGREIENYIGIETIQRRFPDASAPPGQFEEFATYLDTIQDNEGKRFERNKALFAESIIPGITRDNIRVLDLPERIDEAVSRIRKWNGM